MEANDIIKRPSKSLEDIYDMIRDANERGDYKIFIPHWAYFPDNYTYELINHGFKVCHGRFDGLTEGLIIEW